IEQLANGLVNNIQALIAYPNINHGGNTQGTLYYHRYSGLLSQKLLPGFFPYANGCCLLIANDRLDSSQLFDEDFFMYGEDVELSYRLGVNKLTHINKTLAFHEGNASTKNGSLFYESHILNSHFLLAKKLSKTRIDFYILILFRTIIMSLRATIRTIRIRSITPSYALIYLFINRLFK
ncbi:MAG TPA: hypothetical protein VKA34_11335, partial [Balneolales bacterium]|nr:hypothetical protein [Balneolales bacterium]